MTNQPSASQRLHEVLGKMIAAKGPDERLPSEPELAQELGVSRATLREAMRTFETQGLIRRKQGAGTFVIHPSYVIESGLEVLESIEKMAKRIGLQVSMGELKVENRPPTQEENKILGLEAGKNIIKVARVIDADHRSVAYLEDLVPADLLSPQDINRHFNGSVLDLFLQRGSPPLLTSRCEINAVVASHNVARALGIQRGDVLLRFVAYLYSSAGRIVDYSFSYFLPGYFHFHVVRRVG